MSHTLRLRTYNGNGTAALSSWVGSLISASSSTSYRSSSGHTPGEFTVTCTPSSGYTLEEIYVSTSSGYNGTAFPSDCSYSSGSYKYILDTTVYNNDSLTIDITVYFIEDSDGGDSGDSGGSGSSASWDIERFARSQNLDYANQWVDIDFDFAKGKIGRFRFTPDVDGTFDVSISGRSGDIYYILAEGTLSISGDENSTADDLFSGVFVDETDTNSGMSGIPVEAGVTYNCYWLGWDIDTTISGTLELTFNPDYAPINGWQSIKNITTITGTLASSNSFNIENYNVGCITFIAPAYPGKMILQTTDNTTGTGRPNFYSNLFDVTTTVNTSGDSLENAVITTGRLTYDDDNDNKAKVDVASGAITGANTLNTVCRWLNTATSAKTYYWYVNPDFSTSGTTTIPYKINYYRRYNITYNANGGSGAPSTQYFYDDNKSTTLSTTTPTRSNYTFKGWATSNNATSATYASGASVTPSGNLSLYAVWQRNTITITYNANGGSGAPSAQTVNQGDSVTISSTIPTRSGYEFKGWATSSSATSANYQSGSTYSTITSSITIYAVWQIVNYTITYDMNGGSGTALPQTFNVLDKTLIIRDETPIRVGYTFKGWSTSSTATTATYIKNTSYTFSLQNYLLYAVWVPVTYTISYNANGGTGSITSQTKTYGTNITLAASGMSKTGYTFSHWNTRADNSGISYRLGATYSDEGTANVVLYAIYTNNTYTLIYDANGGSGGPASDSREIGQQWTINVVTAPSRPGYTFKGWSTTKTAIQPTYKSKTFPVSKINVVTTGMTLYAIWWPHFEWTEHTTTLANQLVDYLETYCGTKVSYTSDIYDNSWYNSVAYVLGVELMEDIKIIQDTDLQDLANAFNSFFIS